jgi:glycosyltransferase involved in cell wall biosynthesis
MTNDYQVTWRGIVHDASGYSRAAREHALALDAAGVDVRVEPLNYGTPSVELAPAKALRLNALIARPKAADKFRVVVCHVQPDTFDPDALRSADGFHAAACAVCWETTRTPAHWPAVANRYDAIIAASGQNVTAFRDSGIIAPVLLVPYGIDAGQYGPAAAPTPPPVPGGRPFTFLSIFQWGHRKAPELLLRAYWEEFSRDDGVALVVQTNDGCGSVRWGAELREHLRRWKSSRGFGADRAPLLLGTDLLGDAALAGLYAAADAFVLPTRGEAVGMPFMEAMAYGLPVIATAWGGHTDFLNAANSLPVACRLVPATATHPDAVAPRFEAMLSADMLWAECDLGDLRRTMRYAVEHPGEMRALGARALRDAERLTWSETGRKLRAAVETMLAVRG